jgi:hypothetical protein
VPISPKFKTMKTPFLFFLMLGFFQNLSSQQIISNFQENQTISWGSVSAQGPSFGFYGQEFVFPENVEINAVSVYIFDHADHDETKASINYSIWSFDEKPVAEIFSSEAVQVSSDEIKGWKAYTFKKPLKLEKGKYLFGVGQPAIQGFVAFGDGIAKEGYKSNFWCMMPLEGFSDGKNWFNILELMELAGVPEEDRKKLEQAVVMMKIEYK